MNRTLCGGLVIAAARIGGCAPTPPPSTQPAMTQLSPDQVAALRMRFETQGMAFGQVVAVYAPANRAAIGDVQTSAFKVGDVFSFIDASGNTIAFGRVVKIEPDILHVTYDASAPGHRAPNENDFAVAATASPAPATPAPTSSPAGT